MQDRDAVRTAPAAKRTSSDLGPQCLAEGYPSRLPEGVDAGPSWTHSCPRLARVDPALSLGVAIVGSDPLVGSGRRLARSDRLVLSKLRAARS